MQQLKTETEVLPPPPGIIGSLKSGFDIVATHITAILLPLAIDLLLWLGPHLSMDQVAQPVLKEFSSMAAGGGISQSDISNAVSLYNQFFQQFNLLGILRTFPIGVFSLMSAKMPGLSPLGGPVVFQIDSFNHLAGLVFLLTLIGWLLGSLYFRWVAALVTPELLPSTGRAVLQTFLFSVIWSLLAWAFGLPLMLVLYLFFAINPILGDVVLLVLGFLSMWLIVPIFFSPHGMFVKKQNALASILSSFRMARFTLPTSSLFVLTVVMIGIGLNFLWSVPADDSWLSLVGILGHAFITTALLASSFAYYRDMNVWLQTVLERLKTRLPTPQA
ncbi:MAG: hypothetical protein M1282_00335 [Chloroflexi bacterium]|nr:hypothetical protein [Chloroflexota bacterium]